jgi:hypothetical protein
MTKKTALFVAACLLSVLSGAPARAAGPFGAPVHVPSSRGYEPGIDVAASGTVFVNEPEYFHSPGWRSANGGLSFTQISMGIPYNRFPGGGDSDMAVGHDGRVYYADLWVGSNSIERSDDDGLTWTFGTPVSTLPLDDRQWIAVGKQTPDGHDTVYVLVADFSTGSSQLAISRDSGLTWTWRLPPASTGSTGQLVADDNGFLAYTWVDSNGRLWINTSTDEGSTWRTTRLVGPGAGPGPVPDDIQGLALDGTTLHTVYVDKTDYTVHYLRSLDLGATWQPDVVVSSPGSAVFPWVAARNGKVAVSWYGADVSPPTGPDDVGDTARWFIRFAESADGGATFTPQVNADARVVKRGPVCTMGSGCGASGGENRELGDFQQIAIDGSGRALIAYGVIASSPAGMYVVREI